MSWKVVDEKGNIICMTEDYGDAVLSCEKLSVFMGIKTTVQEYDNKGTDENKEKRGVEKGARKAEKGARKRKV